MDLWPQAGVSPGVEVIGDRLPRREVVGQHPPGAAGAGEVTDGVDDLSHRVSAGSPGSAGGGVFQREEVIDVIPLQVREVAGVSHPCFHDDRVHEHSGRREGRFLDGLLDKIPDDFGERLMTAQKPWSP